MADTPKRRTFVVGSGRSGTTLLESLLGAHHGIMGFPESAFFVGIIGQVESRTRLQSDVTVKRRLGRVVSSARIKLGFPREGLTAGYLQPFLTKIGRTDLVDRFPSKTRSIAVQVDAFLEILDVITAEEGKEFWVEKTPLHLFYIDEIERYVKQARFIHIVRRGPDVVASLFDASKRYKGIAWEDFPSLDRCINRWNHAIPMTQRHLQKPNHICITYEQLVDDTAGTLRKLCDFLETDYDPGMLTNYSHVAEFVSGGDPWKSNTACVIENANATKFTTLLTPEQQEYVCNRLLKVDYSKFCV